MANLATINNNILADSGIDPLSLIVGTGTVNYVPKFTAEDTVANSQIFDNGTDVGIGTSSPFVKFDVRGEAMLLYRPAGNAYAIYSAANNTYSWQFGINNGSDYVICGGGFTGLGVEAFRITLGGNVGIGTTSPVTKLDVNGAGVIRGFLTTTDAIKLGGNTSAPTSTDAFIYRPADNTLAFGTASAERMRLDVSGNLLIGLSSALANGKLQVAGSIGLSGNTQIRQATNSDGNTLQVFATQVIAGNLNSYSYGYSGGGLLASVSAGDSILLFDAGRTTSTEGRVKIANTTLGNVSFSVEKNGVTTLFASTLGNVGIGTTSPSTKLHISNAANGNIALFTNTNDADLFINLSSGVTSLSPSTGILAFGTSSTERMRLDASGNLGLGTSSPAAKLHVAAAAVSGTIDRAVIIANSSASGSGSGSEIYLGWNSPSINAGAGVTIGASYAGGGTNMLFSTPSSIPSAPNVKMTLDGNGNLGLGVTPSAWTSTWRAIQLPGGSIYSNAGGTTGQIAIGQNWYYDGTQNRYINSAAASDYYQYAGEHRWFNAPSGTAGNAISFTQAMTLNASGQLLIGTTSAQSGTRLQVAGFLDVWSSANTLLRLNHDGTRGIIETFTGGGYAPTSINPNGGNVLIGTTTDAGYKLDVSGTARITSNLLAQKVQVGTAATINDPPGVANTLQFANYTLGAFITGSADNYIYKNSNVIGGLSSHTLIFQTRSDVAGGGFAFVSGATPSVIANISSNGAVRFNAYGSGSFTGTRAYDLSVDASGNIIEVPVGAGTITGSGTTNYIPKWTSSSAIGNSDLITDGSGNLAIAQGNAPTQALNIYRAGSTQTVMAAGNSNTGLNGTYFGVDANGNGIMNTTGAFANIFSTNGSERMRITSGGNLLVGTTSDGGQKLTVNGDISVATLGSSIYFDTTIIRTIRQYVSGSFDFNIENQRGNTSKIVLSSSTITLGSMSTVAMTVDTSSGNVGIGTTSPTSKLHVVSTGNAAFTSIVTEDNARKVKIGRDQISAWDLSDNATTLYVNSTGNIYMNSISGNTFFGGNVGIGTTSPGSNLTIQQASTSATLGIRHTASGNGYGWRFATTGTTTNDLIFSNEFNGSFTERMRITDGGNVGIGIANPSTILTVYNTNAATLYQTPTSGTASNNGFYVGQISDVSYVWNYNNFPLVFGTNNIERMRLDASGNLGLGVTPSAWRSSERALQIGATTSLYNVFGITLLGNNYFTNSSNQSIYINSAFATYYWQSSSDGSHQWSIAPSGTAGNVISWTQAMTLDASGRLGIGTTSPDVYGVHAYNASNSVYFKSVSGSTTTLYGSATALGVGLLGTFSNSDLTIYTNSSEKMRITSGGNVGIGTSSPANKLQIGSVGSTGFGGNDIAIGNGSQVMTFYQSATISTWYTNTSFSLMPSGVGAVGNVGIGTTSPSNRLTVSGNADITGNVGIGTPTPAYKLDVLGSFNFTTGGNNLTYNNGVLYHGNYYQFPSANDYALFARTSGALIFGANDTERMRITSGGDVGIGTSSPSYKLDVVGVIRSNASNVGTLNLGTDSYSGVYTTAQVIGQTSPSYTSSGKLSFKVLTWGAGSDYGPTEQMYIDVTGPDTKSATLVMLPWGGSVGLGTTTPSSILDARVSSGATSGFRFKGWSDSATPYLLSLGTQTYQDIFQIKSVNGLVTMGIVGAVGATPDLAFQTNSTERMRITSGGNVGIGTSSPSYKLHVVGSIYASNSLTTAGPITVGMTPAPFWNAKFTDYSDGSGVYIGSVQAGGYKYIAGESYYNNSSYWYSDFTTSTVIGLGGGILKFYTDSGLTANTNFIPTERMRITAAGNVGIGTTSPAKALDVYSSANTNTAQIVTSDAGSTNRLYLGTFANNGYITFGGTYQSGWSANGSNAIALINFAAVSGGSIIAFGTSTANGVGPTERMRIDASGNVGIGTSSPAGKLEIVGSSGGLSLKLPSGEWYGASSTNRMAFDNPNQLFHTGGASGAYKFRNAADSADVMTITNTGNVGIGTTSPSDKLDVVGNIRSTNASNSAVYSRLEYDGVYTYATNLYLYAGSGYNAYIYAGGSERMRITGGGNVGIGASSLDGGVQFQVFTSSSPQNLTRLYTGLDVYGPSGSSSAASPAIFMGGDSNTGFFSPTGDNIGFSTNGSERMRITNGGIVGIGTSSPDASTMLQVQTSNSCSVRIVSSAASGGDLYLTSVNSGSESRIDKQGTAGPLTFYNNGSERMRITSSGNTELSGSIKTGTPSGGTAVPWKLGSRITNSCGLPGTYADFASSFMVSNKVIEVEIDGVLVYIPIVNPGWC